jgi:FAD/FMN-containing dehydrogenase
MKHSEELAAIVGKDCVIEDPETLAAYSHDMSFVPPRTPDYVVLPDNAEKIQELVNWANGSNLPLIPVSSGPPRFRGDTIPLMGGVIVDLSKMNQVIRLDKFNRVMMVQPGVTYDDILPQLSKEGLRLAMPLSPRPSKSVVGSVLEREPTTMPRYHWDAADPLCCAEVIFGSGELFRTGEAAGPGGPEAQWAIGGAQKFPLGPHQIDYHRLIQGSQGTMGIVTWASIKCEIKPSIQKLFFVGAKSPDKLFDFTYGIIKQTLSDETLILNSTALAYLIGENSEEINHLRQTLPPWILIFCIAGLERRPEERVAYMTEDMMGIAQKIGITPLSSLPSLKPELLLNALSSVSPEPYWKLKYKGGCQDIFFLTTLNRSTRYINLMYRKAEEHMYSSADVGVYLQPIVQGTSCHVEFILPYNPDDQVEMTQIQNLFDDASMSLIQEQAFFSRPYGTWAEPVYSRNTDVVMALKKIKDVFDPNQVMNPGKLCF